MIDKDGIYASASAGLRKDGTDVKITKHDLFVWGPLTMAATATMLHVLVDDGTFKNGW